MWRVEKPRGSVFYQNEVVGQLGCSEVILLCSLLKEPGRVFTKNELLELGWPGKIVAPNSLTVAIKNIRKIFGYRPSELNIKTIHGQGYVLVEQVNDEIIVVEQESALPEGTVNDEASPTDEYFPYEKHLSSNRSDGNEVPFFHKFTLLESLVKISIFIILVVSSVVMALHDKKVYCDKINGVEFCGSHPLLKEEKNKLLSTTLNETKNDTFKYIYGYNYTATKMVYYPLY